MTCTNCGRKVAVDEYTIRFTSGTSDPTEMELELCRECLSEFRDETGVEVR